MDTFISAFVARELCVPLISAGLNLEASTALIAGAFTVKAHGNIEHRLFLFSGPDANGAAVITFPGRCFSSDTDPALF
jgi:hypothetical protein